MRSLRRSIFILLASAVVLAAPCGCKKQGDQAAQAAPHVFDGRLTVLTSVFPVFALAGRIAGDAADVANLTSGSADPHDFQLTPRDLRSIQNADLVVTIGLGLEPWLDRVLHEEQLGDTPRIALGEHLAGLIENEHSDDIHAHADPSGDHGTTNPHVWLDPALAGEMVRSIADAFGRIDPANAAIYNANAEDCVAELEALDGEIRTLLAPCGAVPFITLHDAFPYFVRRYGLNQAGFIESNANVEPTAGYIIELSTLIRTLNVRVVFTEPGARSRLLMQLADDLDLEIATLDPLERGDDAGDYFEGLRRNAASLRSALAP